MLTPGNACAFLQTGPGIRIIPALCFPPYAKTMTLPADLLAFLACPTPDPWVEQALQHPEELLIDHANCEKKAASTALNLMFRYIDKPELLQKMSRLAREELRHFEQVTALMHKRGVVYRGLSASHYAQRLRQHVRTVEPGRLVDTLIVGASSRRAPASALPDWLRILTLSWGTSIAPCSSPKPGTIRTT